MYRYASGKSSSIQVFFSCVPHAKIFSHAHPGTYQLQPRHYFLASRVVQRSGIAARDVTVTKQQTTSPNEAGARRSQQSGDPRSYHISYHCSGLLSELSDQICLGTAEAIRGGADNGHAMTRMRHVSNDGVIG
jgi:hypothetical protein